MSTLAQKITSKQELADHLALVKERIQEEGLSLIELRRKSRLIMEEVNDQELYDHERELAMAEFNLVEGMISERQASEPTPSDIADYLESTGDLLGAETLRFTIALDAKSQELESAQTALRLVIEEGSQSTVWIEKETARIAALQEAYDELPTAPPVHQRKLDADVLTQEGVAKRNSAALLEDSGDSGVIEQAQSLREESDAAFAEALDLRSFVPEATNTTGTTEPPEGEPAPMTLHERANKIRAGQRRGAGAFA